MAANKNPLTEEEQEYIRIHRSKIPPRIIAADLGRCTKTIYRFIEKEGLPPMRKRKNNTQHNSEFFNHDEIKGDYTWII